jgi:malonyl-CoA O-methyltransferase
VNPEKYRVQAAFSQAAQYDSAASVQAETARRLALKIAARRAVAPERILEIGCGTGLLSQHLAVAFPAAHLTLTLERCKARLGGGPAYQVMDGEVPEGIAGPFDLIASSLAVQWFTDLPGSIDRLTRLLAPEGRLIFATLGRHSFREWRQAHELLGLACGLHDYAGADDFPLPDSVTAEIEQEVIAAHYASGRSFARSLKTLGAATPRRGYRPLPAAEFRRVLARLEGHFAVSYHILYVEIAVQRQ